MPKSYFCQMEADPEVFEQVDEYVFLHRSEVVVQSKTGVAKRYSRLAIVADENDMELVGESRVTLREMSIIARFLGLKPDALGTKNGGFLQEPQNVTLMLRGKQEVLHVMGGDNYVRQPVKKASKPKSAPVEQAKAA